MKIRTQKVWFGSGFHLSNCLISRAKLNLLGTNFKIGSLIIRKSLGTIKDTIYKIRNHACIRILYNHPTSLRQEQSVGMV